MAWRLGQAPRADTIVAVTVVDRATTLKCRSPYAPTQVPTTDRRVRSAAAWRTGTRRSGVPILPVARRRRSEPVRYLK
jgi:hypothetical protein